MPAAAQNLRRLARLLWAVKAFYDTAAKTLHGSDCSDKLYSCCVSELMYLCWLWSADSAVRFNSVPEPLHCYTDVDSSWPYKLLCSAVFMCCHRIGSADSVICPCCCCLEAKLPTGTSLLSQLAWFYWNHWVCCYLQWFSGDLESKHHGKLLDTAEVFYYKTPMLINREWTCGV